jgi:site-specific recombinase XerD
MNYKTYLQSQGAAKNTIQGRTSALNDFENWLEAEQLEIAEVDYNELMNYVAFCKQKGNSVHTIRLKINSLKHYFNYLILENKLNEGGLSLSNGNPAKLVQLKGGTKKIAHGMLEVEELQEIYALQSTKGLAQKRNKVLLSLVIFQGVGGSELGKIELKDVDLINGTIYVPATRTSNARTLELKVQQLLLFQNYITTTRPAILQEANKQSDFFLVHHGHGNTELFENVIYKLIKNIRPYYPKLKNVQQIRQSVITEWVKQHGLRKAQYFAGHRYVSSTERYRVDQLQGLKNELKTHYVLKK